MEINSEKLKNSLLQLKSFVKDQEQLEKYIRLNKFGEKEVDSVIKLLVDNLVDPLYTEPIAVCFPDILLLIVVLAIPSKDESHEFETYLRQSKALSRLIKYSPEVSKYCVEYFKDKQAPFKLQCATETSKKIRTNEKTISDLEITELCHGLLTSMPSFYKELWDWSIFVDRFSDSFDEMQKLYYNEVLSILLNMSPLQLKHLNKHISNDAFVAFQCNSNSKLQTPINAVNMHDNDVQNVFFWKLSSNVVTNIESVLLPLYNNSNAVYYDKTDGICGNIVKVDSTKTNLKNIAMGLSSDKAICLFGPVGSGKTTLVEYLARKTGRISPNKAVPIEQPHFRHSVNTKEELMKYKSQKRKADEMITPESIADIENGGRNGFLRIQMGDQIDSKVLLGQYKCTDVPGEFVWMSGVLTQAVIEGYWLLLEDVDLAPQDSCSILSNLLENNYLNVPGYRDYVKISPGFQLFVTVRSHKSPNRAQTTTLSHFEKYFYTVNIIPLSRNELCQVVSTKYPKLSAIANRIVDIFLMFSSSNYAMSEIERKELNKNSSDYVALPTTFLDKASISAITNSGRTVSTRDLIKLCDRSHETYSATSAQYAYFVFQNAVDIFCSYLPQSSVKTILITNIGARLSIIQSRCEYFSNDYKPDIGNDVDGIKAGRSFLNIKQTTNIESRKRASDNKSVDNCLVSKKIKIDKNVSFSVFQKEKAAFSFTRVACCLLERIGVCIAHSEPILLVGETGVGKTSCVQYLAAKTDHRLVVVNMNNQSDISDLIGGFKPVDIRYILAPLKHEFEVLFRKTFNETKNEKFLSHVSACYNRGDFGILIKLMLKIAVTVFKRAEKNELKIMNLRAVLNKWHELNSKLLKLNSQLNSSINISFAFVSGSLVNCIQNGDWVLLDEINLASDETLECLSTVLERDGSVVLLEKGELTPVNRHPDFRIFACMNPRTDIGKKDLPTSIRNRFTEFFVDEIYSENDLNILIGDYLKNTGINPTKISSIVKLYQKLRSLSQIELNDGLGNRPIFSLRTLCRALTITAKNLCGSIDRNLYESFCLSFLTQLDNESHTIVLDLIGSLLLSNRKVILSQEIPKPGENFINFEGYWVEKGPKDVLDCTDYIITDTIRKNLKDVARIISIGKLPILLQGPTSAGKTSMIEYIAKKSGNHCLRINNHEHTDLQEYIGTYISDSSGKLIFKEGILVDAMRNGYWIILDELNLASTDILEALNRVLDDNRELFIPETQTVIKAHPKFMLFATQNPPGLYGGRKTLSRAFKNRFIELHFSEIPKAELEVILEKRCLIPKSYSQKMVKCMSELQINRKTTTKSNFTLRDLFRWGNRYTYADKKLSENNSYDWNEHLVDEGYLVLSSKVRSEVETEIIKETLFKHFRKKVVLNNLFSYHEKTSLVTKDILGTLFSHSNRGQIVWTQNLTRMAVLTAKAIQFNEPALLVGPTGCGKTTICQILAEMKDKKLRILNCHMHTEGADFLGGLRPSRSKGNTFEENSAPKLFEWVDGPLIHAMREGSYFMVDEISLAEDSVLERLNSVLEPNRTIVLAEKGGVTKEDANEFIVKAEDGFEFLATMNPGGDFGKKELSPALRNRFTEIWCDPSNSEDDLIRIASNALKLVLNGNENVDVNKVAKVMISMVMFLKKKLNLKFSVRDILAWAHYVNLNSQRTTLELSILFGLDTLFLDSLEMLSNEIESNILTIKRATIDFAVNILKKNLKNDIDISLFDGRQDLLIEDRKNSFGIEPFFIDVNTEREIENVDFEFNAPTTKTNLFRLLSALSVNKAILLEGAPGVGKTSTIESLARAIGYQIIRINLCEHTDLADLFGTDLPADDTSLDIRFTEKTNSELKILGSFIWRDGPLLAALKAKNTWILLDELNLAPQSVLEGLNAILDHRKEVYIPELNKTFTLNKETRIFGCQNPLRQGGGRKGLPQSFLNRFTKVYLRKLCAEDLFFVVSAKYDVNANVLKNYFERFLKHVRFEDGYINLFTVVNSESEFCTCNEPNSTIFEFDLLERIVRFSDSLEKGLSNLEFGTRGGPFEINLRDLLRWCEFLFNSQTGFLLAKPSCIGNGFKMFKEVFNDFLLVLYERMKVVYCERMRCDADKDYIQRVFSDVFECNSFALNTLSEDICFYWTDSELFLNDIALNRAKINNDISKSSLVLTRDKKYGPIILKSQLETLKNVVECVQMEKTVILSGPSNSGKTKIIESMCSLSNRFFETEIIEDSVMGSYQQIDLVRHLEEISQRIEKVYLKIIHNILLQTNNVKTGPNLIVNLMHLWSNYAHLSSLNTSKQRQSLMSDEIYLFKRRIKALLSITSEIKQIEGQEMHIEDIENSETALKLLEKIIFKTDALNAGGHFEWVDSKIVKCLKIGGFICLDHANMCSPAILDRLNSAFEPNGSILISEKGIGYDNKNEQIKKHDEFRAFLTIDPKHGELSRAMRNRCVELDLSKKSYSEDDLRHIIYINGITEFYLIDVIVSIYKSCNGLSELGYFNISNLIHFTHLIACNKRAGLRDFEAVYNSGVDVFIRSSTIDLLGYGLEFYHNKLRKIIQDNCEKILPHAELCNLSNVILRPKNLSTISMVKLQVEPVFAFLSHHTNGMLAKTSLGSLFTTSSSINIKNPLEFSKYYILGLYAVSSLNDVSLRNTYLSNVLSKSEKFNLDIDELKYLEVLNSLLYDAIIKNGSFASKNRNLPWNSKLFPRIRGIRRMDPERNKELCLNVMLFANLLLKPIEIGKLANLNEMSAACYSEAVCSGKISDNFNNIVLLELWPLLKKCEEILHSSFHDIDLDIGKYSTLIISYLWFNRLHACSKRKVAVNNKLDMDLIDTLLLHFKWLNKHLLLVILKFRKTEDKLSADLKQIINKYENYTSEINHPMNMIQKLYSKLFTSFLPRYTQEQIDLHDHLCKIDEMTSLSSSSGVFEVCQIERNIRCVLSREYLAFKHLASSNIRDLTSFAAKVGDVVLNVEKLPDDFKTDFFEYFNAADKVNEQEFTTEISESLLMKVRQVYNSSSDNSTESAVSHMELWPFKDYYGTKAILLCSISRQSLTLNEQYFSDISAYSCLTQRILKLMSTKIYQMFIRMWLKLLEYVSKCTNPCQFGTFLGNITQQYYRHLSSFNRMQIKMIQSHCLYVANSWKLMRVLKKAPHCHIERNKYNGPPLTNSVLTILFDEDGNLRPIILKDLDDWKYKLSVMRHTLWNNSVLMSNELGLEKKQLYAVLNYSKKIICEIDYLMPQVITETRHPDSEYHQHFQELIKCLKSIQDSAEELNNESLHPHNLIKQQLLHISLINSLVGAIELSVSIYMPLIDPVEKNRLKNLYQNENLECLEKILSTYDLLKIAMRYQGLAREEYEGFQSLLVDTKSKISKLAQKVALRPETCMYNELVEHVNYFLKMNAKPEILLELVKSALKCAQFENIVHNKGLENKQTHSSFLLESSEILKKLDLWIVNSERFLFDLKNKFSSYYTDITEPLECSTIMTQTGLVGLRDVLTQIRNSICILSNKQQFSDTTETQNVYEILHGIFQFPKMRNHAVDKVNFETNLENLQRLLANSSINLKESERLYLFMLNAFILEVKNEISVFCRVEEHTFHEMQTIISSWHKLWQAQEESKRRKEIEESSLYVNKTLCETENEEELELQEIQNYFPVHIQDDFNEFIVQESLEKTVLPKKEKVKELNLIDIAEHKFIATNFMSIMELYASNYYSKGDATYNVSEYVDYVTPFKVKLDVFSKLLCKYKSCLNTAFDCAMFNTFGFIVGIQQDSLQEITLSATNIVTTNFYVDSNMSEISPCMEVMEKIISRANEQLALYPDHAVLIDIIGIIGKIQNFPSTSAIARFNTGFQILQQKLSQWNGVAHKKNNFRDLETEVAEYVQRWTKMELQYWRNCLLRTLEIVQDDAYRYFLFMYNLVYEYANEKQNEKIVDEITGVLRQFVENSNYGDFSIRMRLLRSFEMFLHFVYPNDSHQKDTFIAIFRNIQIYFNQFARRIDDSIKSFRTPIEKKLRELVKIESYNKDLSYFSVKSNVNRVHRNLNKYLKQYENLLRSNIASVFQQNENVSPDYHLDNDKGINLRYEPKHKYYMLDAKNFLASKKKKSLLEKFPADTNNFGLLSKCDKLFSISRTVVREIIDSTQYSSMIKTLDMLLSDQIETCEYLRQLNVDTQKEKSKQKAEAKNILSQKKKCLSDLYKTLEKLGMNYKTGLMELSIKADITDFTIQPFCVKTMFTSAKGKKLEQNLIWLSENLDTYYAKCIFKLKMLQNIMLTPNADLGVLNNDRIKGFSVDMFLLIQNQRRVLGQYMKDLYDLRKLIEDLNALYDCANNSSDTVDWCDFEKSEKAFNNLRERFRGIQMFVEQFIILLKCLPITKSEKDTALLEAVEMDDYIKYSEAHAKLSKISTEMRRILVEMAKKEEEAFLNAKYIESLRKVYDETLFKINHLRDQLNSSKWGELPISTPLHNLIKGLKIEKPENSFKSANYSAVENISNEIENIVHSVLLSLQKLYKRYRSNYESDLTNDDSKIEEATLLENHLKIKIYERVRSDIEDLKLWEVNQKLSNVTLAVKYTGDGRIKKENINKLLSILPILEQFNLMGDFYLFQQLGAHKVSAKMLSVMLTVFVELGIKGFCIPPEIMEEEKGEERVGGKERETFGLEDGTGENDVSEKIESEDQLDDARRPEDRKDDQENEDNKCKEEKGIEMSEDFDANLQDVNESDEVNSDKSDDDDKFEKQMGEADTTDEKLDDQIWGSDEEKGEDDDENDVSDDDGGGKKREADKHNDFDLERENESQENDEEKKEGLDPTVNKDNLNKEIKKQDEIDTMNNEEGDEEQTNPHHNTLEEPIEPEEMDLGECNLDEANCKDDEGDQIQNPFEIDKMKECMDFENESPEIDQEDIEESKEDVNDTYSESEAEFEDVEKTNERDAEADENKEEEQTEDIASAEKDDQINTKNGETADVDDKPEEIVTEGHMESEGKTNKEENVHAAEDSQNKGSVDQVVENSNLPQDSSKDVQDTGEDRENIGQAENDSSEDGHRGAANSNQISDKFQENQQTRERRKGNVNEERTLGKKDKSQAQQLKAVDNVNENQEENDAEELANKLSDEYQHVKEARESDMTTLDNATEDQAKQVEHQNEMAEDENELEGCDDLKEIEQDDCMDDTNKVPNMNGELLEEKSKNPSQMSEKTNEKCETTEKAEVEGEQVNTYLVARESITTAHCNKSILAGGNSCQESTPAESLEMQKLFRANIVYKNPSLSSNADYEMWQSISNKMATDARELCEQLRLILEPTKCTRLKGDYRTGRRINMRKIIPYIASQFRKDKIWLRRTKPSQRDYKITIAIDDSKSMHHNNSKRLTLEAISLVSQALILLESGKLSIVSFGESPNVLLHHSDQFDGPKLVRGLEFAQNQSKIAELLDFVRTGNSVEGFNSESQIFENLLLIISDGRNIFSEGESKVKNAVKLARLQRMFLVYVIIDNPDNKHSILDIRVPEFSVDRRSITMKSYLDTFPFPYYVIVRDLGQLPIVLSEAMRQWFELVNSEH